MVESQRIGEPKTSQTGKICALHSSSSSSSERVFSAAVRLIEQRRTALKPATVDAVLFLHFDFTQFKQNHPKKEKNNQKTDRRKYQHYFIFHKLANGFTAIFNTQTNSNFLDRSFKYQIFVTPVFQSMISVSKLHSKRIIINTIIQEGTFYHRETK